jgi:hypothetical protein
MDGAVNNPAPRSEFCSTDPFSSGDTFQAGGHPVAPAPRFGYKDSSMDGLPRVTSSDITLRFDGRRVFPHTTWSIQPGEHRARTKRDLLTCPLTSNA